MPCAPRTPDVLVRNLNHCINYRPVELILIFYEKSRGLSRHHTSHTTYENKTDKVADVCYYFPTTLESSFTGLTCSVSGQEIVTYFETREKAINFYSQDKNYKSLMRGDIGENLSSKYTGKALLILDDIITTLFYVIRKKFNKKFNEELNVVLDSSEKWLKNLYLIDAIFSDSKLEKNKKDKLKIDFDFPEWLQNDKQPFEKFKKNSTYEFSLDLKKIDYIRNEIETITLAGKDRERAFSRYIERRSSESNFFKYEFEKII